MSFVPELNYLPLLSFFPAGVDACFQEEMDGSTSKTVFSFCQFSLSEVPGLLIETV